MVSNSHPTYDEKKFRELVVYISEKCESDLYFNATKLNKILFFSDFLAYKLNGEPITGADYFALPYGPAPRRLLPVREQMVMDGDITLSKRQQHRTIALRPPDYDVFSASEIALVDKVIDILRDYNADETSELSHIFLGWQAAMAEGEESGEEYVSIPYSTVFVMNPPIDEYENAYGLELMKKHGW